MELPDYLKAAFPDPFTVLGKRLHPFSLGHALLLRRFECDPVETLDQLIRAVIICSRPAARVLEAFDDPRLNWKLKWWSFRLRRLDRKRSKRSAEHRSAPTIKDRIALFHEYIACHTGNGPRVLESEEFGTGGPSGAPFLQHLRTTLISRLHYSPAEAMDAPYSLALWDYYTYWENEGRADIHSEERLAWHDLANAMDGQTREKAEAMCRN